jgi:quercetin dioxygenase-like cupin family protein
MISIPLNDNLVFHDKDAFAEPLFVGKTGRILRFALNPGQSVAEHMAPHSPVYIVVLKGLGLFSGGDKRELSFGPGTLLVLEEGEAHAIRAGAEELVFVAILHGAPGAQ